MMMNPVLNKELIIGSRSIKLPLALCLYNLVLGLVAILVLFIVKEDAAGSGVNYQILMGIFPILATLQCFIILVMIPILTASSIAGERERQTLDVMLTTPISAFSIVLGKVLTAMAQVLMFVISSVPIMSLAFILGGMPWTSLIGFILMVIFASFYVGAIGVYCSAKTKKTIVSVIKSFIIIAVFMVGTLIAMGVHIFSRQYDISQQLQKNPNLVIQDEVGMAPLWVAFNPAVTVGNYVFKTFFGAGIERIGAEAKNSMNGLMYFLTQHWTVITVILNLLVAFGFIALAARNINPLKKVKPFKKQRKMNQVPETPAISE